MENNAPMDGLKGVDDFTFTPRSQSMGFMADVAVPVLCVVALVSALAVTSAMTGKTSSRSSQSGNDLALSKIRGMEKAVSLDAETFWLNAFKGDVGGARNFLSPRLSGVVEAFGDKLCKKTDGVCGMERGTTALSKAISNALSGGAGDYDCRLNSSWIVDQGYCAIAQRNLYAVRPRGPHVMSGICTFSSAAKGENEEVRADMTMKELQGRWVVTKIAIRVGNEILNVTESGTFTDQVPAKMGGNP